MTEFGKFNPGTKGGKSADGLLGTGFMKDGVMRSLLQPLSPDEIFERYITQIDKSSHLLTSEVKDFAYKKILSHSEYRLAIDNAIAQILAGRSEVTKIQATVAYINRLLPNNHWALLPPEAQWDYIKNNIPSFQSRFARAITQMVPAVDTPDDAHAWIQHQATNGNSPIHLLDQFITMEMDGGLSESTRALNQSWMNLLSQWSIDNTPPDQWISPKVIDAWKSLGEFPNQWPALTTIVQGFDEARQVLITAQAAMSIPHKLDDLIEQFGVNPNKLAEALAHLRQTPVMSDHHMKLIPMEWQLAFQDIEPNSINMDLLKTMHDVRAWLNDRMDLSINPFSHQTHTIGRIAHWADQMFKLPEYEFFSSQLISQAETIMSLQSSVTALKNYVNTLPDYHRGIVLLHAILGRPDLAPALSGLVDWNNPTLLALVDQYFEFSLSELPPLVLKSTPLVENGEIHFSIEWWRKNKPDEPPEWVSYLEQFNPTMSSLFLFGVGFPLIVQYHQPVDRSSKRKKTVSEEDEEAVINELLAKARNANRNINNLFNIWGIERLEDVMELLPIGQRELIKVTYRDFPELAYRLILCDRLSIDARMYSDKDRKRIADHLVERVKGLRRLPRVWFR